MKKLLALLLLSPLLVSETYYCPFTIDGETEIQKFVRDDNFFKALYPYDESQYDTFNIIYEDNDVLMLSFFKKDEYSSELESFILNKEDFVYQWGLLYPEKDIDAETAVLSGKCLRDD